MFQLGKEGGPLLCPWYPTMRLFRQTWPGDWQGVFQRIAAELAGVARGDGARLIAPRQVARP
jgi:hypothetical protein